MSNNIRKKKYLGGLIVTITSHGKPKQVREVFKCKSMKEAVALAIERA